MGKKSLRLVAPVLCCLGVLDPWLEALVLNGNLADKYEFGGGVYQLFCNFGFGFGSTDVLNLQGA